MSERGFPESPRVDRFETRAVTPKPVDQGCTQVANQIHACVMEQRNRLAFILEGIRGPEEGNHSEGPTGPGLLPILVTTRGIVEENEQLIETRAVTPKPVDQGCTQVANQIHACVMEQRNRLAFILEGIRGPEEGNHSEGPTGPGLLPILVTTRGIVEENEQLIAAIARVLGTK